MMHAHWVRRLSSAKNTAMRSGLCLWAPKQALARVQAATPIRSNCVGARMLNVPVTSGVFVTLGDSASSAGVRRIEALTGEAAFAHLRAQDARMAELALTLKAQPDDIKDRVASLMDERKALQNEVAELRRQVAMGGGAQASNAPLEVGGVPFLAMKLDGVTGKDLPPLIDAQKDQHGSIAVLLIADTGGKVAVAAGVSNDLTDKVSAVDLVKAAVPVLGGKGGGGRPDMAQGGGSDASQSDAAIEAAKAVLEG